jgi:predicted ribosome quality control (RQC) complex YloA/Tae2 family protein
MSDALIVGIISAIVSLIGIFVSAKMTRDEVTHRLDTNQQVMNNEITHIRNEIGDMKVDIRSHNNYAKLFNENLPVIKEKLSVVTCRIDNIEKDIKFYHRKPTVKS